MTVQELFTSKDLSLLYIFDFFLSSSTSGDENFVENKGLLDYSKLGESIKPRSLAVSEFHFLLLIGNKVKVQILTNQKGEVSYWCN